MGDTGRGAGEGLPPRALCPLPGGPSQGLGGNPGGQARARRPQPCQEVHRLFPTGEARSGRPPELTGGTEGEPHGPSGEHASARYTRSPASRCPGCVACSEHAPCWGPPLNLWIAGLVHNVPSPGQAASGPPRSPLQTNMSPTPKDGELHEDTECQGRTAPWDIKVEMRSLPGVIPQLPGAKRLFLNTTQCPGGLQDGWVPKRHCRWPRPALTGVLVLSFRRSGISALLGLWALLTMGLDGGSPRLPLPAALQLAFRPGSRSSLSSASPVLVGLRLGCRGAGDGPPGGGRGRGRAGITQEAQNGPWVNSSETSLLAGHSDNMVKA